MTDPTSDMLLLGLLKNLIVLHIRETDPTSDMLSWGLSYSTRLVSQQREAAKRTKVDEYGFILYKTPGVSGAGLCECKRQKRDASPRGKAKLVDVSTNAEESASLVGTSSTDNDNVDPLQLHPVGTYPMDNDNVDPFQLPLVGNTPTDNDNVDPVRLPRELPLYSPGYMELWSLPSPMGNDNVDPFQLPLEAPLYSPGYMELWS